jgi:transporter family-2 protein
MGRGVAVVVMAFAGGLIALQAPINARLGREVGSLPAAFVSFAVGLVALFALIVVVGEVDNVARVRHAPWWALIGGILGAVYVTCALIAVRSLGAGGVTAATIAGQLALSVVVDQLGWLGVAQRSITAPRIVGVMLLVAGVALVVRE